MTTVSQTSAHWNADEMSSTKPELQEFLRLDITICKQKLTSPKMLQDSIIENESFLMTEERSKYWSRLQSLWWR